MLSTSLTLVIFAVWHFAQIQKKETRLKFSEFMAQVEAGQVQEVTITGDEIKGKTTSHDSFRTTAPPYGPDDYVKVLMGKKVIVRPYLGTITRPAAPSPGRAEK
jgi:ATP-dependent Zn protease